MTAKPRWAALDNLRGLTIFFMLPINAVMDFPAVPAWFKHAAGDGVTLADFIMPSFLFALGLSASFSLPARWNRSPWKTVAHAALRNGVLFTFGTIGYFLVWQQQNWEVLQMLGCAGALSFGFLLLPLWPRLVVAFGFLLVTEVFRPAFFGPAFQQWFVSGLGGPAGTVPLVFVVLFASSLGEFLNPRPPREKVWVSLGTGLALLLAAGAAFLAGGAVSKPLLTPAYLLLTTGAASVLLGLFSLGDRPLPVLASLGRNPLLAYLLGGILTLVIRGFVAESAPALVAWACGAGVLTALAVISWALDRRGLYLKL